MSDLVIERVFRFAPEVVWHALTDREELASWFWPQAFATTTDIELRPSGSFRIASLPMQMAVSGEYLEVEPQRRLSHTWRWDGDDYATRVSVTLAPAEGGTLLTLTHTGFADDGERDSHIQGWNDCFDRLATRSF